jgi:predicted nucleic acid-binding Zn ribbon protein
MSQEIMRRRKQQAQLQSIGEVLFSILKKRGMTSNIEDTALRKLWPKAVGPQIVSKTKPDSLRNGTLFVKTVSSVWVQQLHFVKEEIRSKLNELYGKPVIKEIRFLVGHTLAQEKKEDNVSLTKKTVLKKRDREMIAQCTEALADSELAGILKRVMQVEISRRRQRENEKVQ